MNLNKIIDNLDLSRGVWVPIVAGIILLLITLLMPKRRINWIELYITFGIIAGLTWMIDTVMGSIVDVYDLGAPGKTGIGDMISLGIVPSALSVIFLNYYKLDKKWLYAILFSAFSVFYQWAMVKAGYMILKTWHAWWSIPVYLFMFRFFLPWHLTIIRDRASNEKKDSYHDPEFTILRRKEKIR